jgi:hypothetical protein
MERKSLRFSNNGTVYILLRDRGITNEWLSRMWKEIVKVKFPPMLNYVIKHYARKAYRGMDFLDLGTGWKRLVSFTSRPLYPWGNSPQYPFDRRLGGHRAGLDNVEKRKFLTLPQLELRHLGHSVRRQSLYRLSYPGLPEGSSSGLL